MAAPPPARPQGGAPVPLDPARALASALAPLSAPGMAWACEYMLGRGGAGAAGLGGGRHADALAVLTAPAQFAAAALVRATATLGGRTIRSDGVLVPALAVGDHSVGVLVLREREEGEASAGDGQGGEAAEVDGAHEVRPAAASAFASAAAAPGGGSARCPVTLARVCLNHQTGEALLIGSELPEVAPGGPASDEPAYVRVASVGSAGGHRVDLTVERRALEVGGFAGGGDSSSSGRGGIFGGWVAAGVRRVACESCAAERDRDRSGGRCACASGTLVKPAGPLDFDGCRKNARTVGGVYVGLVRVIGGGGGEVVWRLENRNDEVLAKELVRVAVQRIGGRRLALGAWGGSRSLASDGSGSAGDNENENENDASMDMLVDAAQDARLERRRERNRLSAASANARRKVWIADLKRDLAAIQARLAQLQAREAGLRSENEVLRRRLEYRAMFGGSNL